MIPSRNIRAKNRMIDTKVVKSSRYPKRRGSSKRYSILCKELYSGGRDLVIVSCPIRHLSNRRLLAF